MSFEAQHSLCYSLFVPLSIVNEPFETREDLNLGLHKLDCKVFQL